MAVVAAVFTGCSDDNDPTYLNEIQVSQSYVSLSTAGGTTTIDVKASGSWTVSGAPEWLTVSPASGTGSGVISFSAGEGVGRTAEVLISCEGKTQRVNIIQGIAKVETATCAQVIAGPDSKNYRVTGVCTRIANTNYGNWYLNDGTGEIYIYGTVNSGGSYAWASFDINVGDVVTVEGPKTTYNGTVELVDATFIIRTKSLVKVEEGETNAFDAAGGDFTVRLSISGDGPYIEIDDEAKGWLGVTSVIKTDSTVNVGFHVAENQSEKSRSANINFTSTSGKSSSTVSASVSQMGLAGTLTNPFSVADAIAYCQSLDGVSANDFYVKGIISEIANNGLFGSYGNATFWISDDGEYHNDLSLDFEAYRVLWLGNEKWTEGHAQISVGDEVLLHGKLTLYKGTAETSGNAAYIYSINSVTDDANGIGSLAAPFTPAGAKAFIDNGGTNDVYVSGVVSKIVYKFDAEHGTGTFWISADGNFNDDPAKDFEAYGVYWLGNKSWVDGNGQVEIGDNVVLHGQLTKYKTTYETSSKKAYVYSVNGKTE